MKKTIIMTTAAVLCGFVLQNTSVSAATQQDSSGRPLNPREACREDARSFCSNVQPGGGRIKDCLLDHYKEVSDDCYDALQSLPPPPQQGQGDSRGNDPETDDRGPPPENGR